MRALLLALELTDDQPAHSHLRHVSASNPASRHARKLGYLIYHGTSTCCLLHAVCAPVRYVELTITFKCRFPSRPEPMICDFV